MMATVIEYRVEGRSRHSSVHFGVGDKSSGQPPGTTCTPKQISKNSGWPVTRPGPRMNPARPCPTLVLFADQTVEKLVMCTVSAQWLHLIRRYNNVLCPI